MSGGLMFSKKGLLSIFRVYDPVRSYYCYKTTSQLLCHIWRTILTSPCLRNYAFSRTFIKESQVWRINDASCSVYPWKRSMMSWSFSRWYHLWAIKCCRNLNALCINICYLSGGFDWHYNSPYLIRTVFLHDSVTQIFSFPGYKAQLQ